MERMATAEVVGETMMVMRKTTLKKTSPSAAGETMVVTMFGDLEVVVIALHEP